MLKFVTCLLPYFVAHHIIQINGAIYTYEDLELRRLFPSEFPQDTVRKSGFLEPQHLGRYVELSDYFNYPKKLVNSHFEELACYRENNRKVCRIDADRYSPEENQYYLSKGSESHVDRQRVYCFMLLCFTEDESDDETDLTCSVTSFVTMTCSQKEAIATHTVSLLGLALTTLDSERSPPTTVTSWLLHLTTNLTVLFTL